MEHMVEQGERNVDEALRTVDEAEVVLSRAARRRAKEAKVLPLYKPLAASLEDTDFSAPLIQAPQYAYAIYKDILISFCL